MGWFQKGQVRTGCAGQRGGRAELREGKALPEKGCSWLGFVLHVFYLRSKESLPLIPPYGQISLSNMTGNKRQITFMSHKVVLKHKSICLAKSYLSLVASLDPKLPDCGMIRQGVSGGQGSGACVINCSSTSLFPWRILQETTGPTGWQWLSWSLLSSPSCRCSSKVINSKEMHRPCQRCADGRGNEREPHQVHLWGENDSILPPSTSPLSLDVSERVEKMIGGAGIHNLEALIVKRRVSGEILLTTGKVL